MYFARQFFGVYQSNSHGECRQKNGANYRTTFAASLSEAKAIASKLMACH